MTSSFFIIALAMGQPPAASDKPAEPKIRYGVTPLIRLYQQSSPKIALDSAVKAMEKSRFDYVAAQLLDPAFVDRESTRRGVAFMADVEAEFRTRRIRENEGFSGIPRDQRVPAEPDKLQPLLDAECQARGFRKFVNDLRGLSADDPSQLKELRRFLRDGQIAESGDTAKVTLADTRDRFVFLKKIDGRWYLENRTADEPAKANP
jgi:hypothetical protein